MTSSLSPTKAALFLRRRAVLQAVWWDGADGSDMLFQYKDSKSRRFSGQNHHLKNGCVPPFTTAEFRFSIHKD